MVMGKQWPIISLSDTTAVVICEDENNPILK